MNQNNLPKPIVTIDSIIAEKGEEWRTTLDYARTTIPQKFLSDKNLIRLTKGAATISQTELMVKLLFQDSKERPIGVPGIDLFFRVVDHSNFNLGSWLAAVTYFQDWLSSENRTTPFQKMLGYLQCCEDSPENKDIDHVFLDLVADMIREHGYVG
ncbi:MAG: hypothetical protein H7336_05690 [Bacteriovorax sp.]|nr:hypothetical protein [Bacteriovorax sp.]